MFTRPRPAVLRTAGLDPTFTQPNAGLVWYSGWTASSKYTASSAGSPRISFSCDAMKAACFSSDATRGRGLALRYSKPSRDRSLMQPEWEQSRPNSAQIWARISAVERQKRASSHAHKAAPASYGTGHPSSHQRQVSPIHFAGSFYTSRGWCHRPDTGNLKSLGSTCRRRAVASQLPDGQCRGLRADDVRKAQEQGVLMRE